MYNFNSRLQLEKGAFAKENILKLLELYATECTLVNCESVADLIIEDFWKDLDYFSENYEQQLNNYDWKNVICDITTFYSESKQRIKALKGILIFEELLSIHINTYLLEIVNCTINKSWNDTLTKNEILSGISFLNESSLDFDSLFY